MPPTKPPMTAPMSVIVASDPAVPGLSAKVALIAVSAKPRMSRSKPSIA